MAKKASLILTRPEVIDVRELVTVAEITRTARGLAAEVAVPDSASELAAGSVVNCDGLHTVRQSSLTKRAAELGDSTMRQVCRAVSYALGCQPSI